MKLFIGDSCMLHYFTENLKSEKIFDKIYYTYHEKTSTCIFDEVSNPNSILTKEIFDYYLIGMGDTLRKELYYQITSGANDKQKNFVEIIETLIDRLCFSIEKIRMYSNNPIFLSTYVIDIYQNKMFSYKFMENPIKYHFMYLTKIYDIAERFNNVFVFDLNRILSDHNHDKSMYRHEIYGSHTEIGSGKYLTKHFKDLLEGISQKNKIKVVVTDLDNTLWDGVLRESKTSPKLHHFRIQVLNELISMGIIVCVSSKNDPDVNTLNKIKEILGILSRKIPIYKISWNRKSDSILEISNELNVGLDTIAFFDDQIFERDEVKTRLPLVKVFSDMDLEKVLYDGNFNFHKISNDSKKRYVTYQQNIERDLDKKNSNYDNYEDYLNTLQMKLSLRYFEDKDIVRVHELISRTNQQNFTLNRFSESDIIEINKKPNNKIILIEVEDKFGDYGVIGTIILNFENEIYSIIEFALSCRAMGKKVEETILLSLNNWVFDKGGKVITTKIHETDKNVTIINQLKNFGFIEVDGLYQFEIKNNLNFPKWFTVQHNL